VAEGRVRGSCILLKSFAVIRESNLDRSGRAPLLVRQRVVESAFRGADTPRSMTNWCERSAAISAFPLPTEPDGRAV